MDFRIDRRLWRCPKAALSKRSQLWTHRSFLISSSLLLLTFLCYYLIIQASFIWNFFHYLHLPFQAFLFIIFLSIFYIFFFLVLSSYKTFSLLIASFFFESNSFRWKSNERSQESIISVSHLHILHAISLGVLPYNSISFF